MAKLSLAVIAALGLAVGSAQASPGHGNSSVVGEPGKKSAATRTVQITMSDNYYEPQQVTVKAGDTVRFVVRNKGELLHEFNIGTPAMHEAHRKEMAQMMQHGMITATGVDQKMMKMPGMNMAHDEPNSVLVDPGKTAEVVWRFTNAGTYEFACNVPGHYEAGMVGALMVGALKVGDVDLGAK